MSKIFLIIREGHSNAGGDIEQKILGSSEGNSDKEALNNFLLYNPGKINYDSERYYCHCGVNNRLYVHAYIKPDEELVRHVANLIWQCNLITGWQNSGGNADHNWERAEIVVAISNEKQLNDFIKTMKESISRFSIYALEDKIKHEMDESAWRIKHAK